MELTMANVLPDTSLCRATAAHVAKTHPPFLLNHVQRSFLFADAVGRREGRVYDVELLYVSCLLHDLGLLDSAPAATRFEVEGADSAVAFLEGLGLGPAEMEVAWDAIALHTTYVIPQRKRAEIALCQLGAAIDVGFAPVTLIAEATRAEILRAFPRLGFKVAMVDALCGLVRRNEAGASMSPAVADVGERLVPGYVRPHICDVLSSSAFDD